MRKLAVPCTSFRVDLKAAHPAAAFVSSSNEGSTAGMAALTTGSGFLETDQHGQEKGNGTFAGLTRRSRAPANTGQAAPGEAV